jgi:hypothetical protein
MFHKHNAFDKIGNNIYLHNNLFFEKELNTIIKCLKNNDKVLWPNLEDNKDQWKINNNINNIEGSYRTQIFGAIVGDFACRFQTTLDLFAPEYIVDNSDILMKWTKGEAWELHSDDSDYLRDGWGFERNNPEWGIYFFIGNCKGGEVLFQKEEIEFIPKSGDLLIYSLKLKHQIKPVLSGVRYLHVNSIFKRDV